MLARLCVRDFLKNYFSSLLSWRRGGEGGREEKENFIRVKILELLLFRFYLVLLHAENSHHPLKPFDLNYKMVRQGQNIKFCNLKK